MRVSVKAAEHDGSGLNGIASLFESREFLCYIGGAGLSMNGRGTIVRNDFVVDLIDYAVAFFGHDGNDAVIGAQHFIPLCIELIFSPRHFNPFFVFLAGEAAIKRLVVYGVSSG